MNIVIILILVSILMILAWAIFSNRGESPVVTSPSDGSGGKDKNDEPERVFRRRSADREIEKEFPAEEADTDSVPDSAAKREDLPEGLKLPFPASEIIPESSRFKLYKRALINSEIYAKRGDIETSISLFKGVRERILDKKIREKIDSNINYLNRFRHRREEDFKKRTESAASPQSGTIPSELRLKIDGPVPQTINIGLPDKSVLDTEELARKLSEQLSGELGNLKRDIERLKLRPDEKFGLDDFAEFSDLQQQFSSLKEKFEDLSSERISNLQELNRLRHEKEGKLEETIKGFDPEQNEILKEIRKDVDNLSNLKHSLDSLHNKVEDLAAVKIPESDTHPTIIQAKYDSPIPIHFDPQPVIDLLDRLSERQRREERVGKKLPAEEIAAEIEDETSEDIIPEPEPQPEEQLPEEESTYAEPEFTAETDISSDMDNTGDAERIPGQSAEPEASLDDLTTLEAAELLDEIDRELPPVQERDEEPLFHEPETTPEKFPAGEKQEEPYFPEPEPEDGAELTEDEIERHTSEHELREDEPLDKKIDYDAEAEEKLKAEREREIEKHIDADEDPNDFDLLSDIGKMKDDSTLSDEDIFERILRDEKKKPDESDFEILGDIQSEDQEINFNDSILDGKKKAEQDFYKKFIKADRIKKRELPILKVSYDFKKLPDEFSLSREKNILEFAFYKYKPMLAKADDFIKHKQVRDAINYYKVVLDQNIPIEFKAMIKRNIRDLTEYLEKYLSSE